MFFWWVIHPSVKLRGHSRLQAPLMKDYTNQGGKIPFQRVHKVRKKIRLTFRAVLSWLLCASAVEAGRGGWQRKELHEGAGAAFSFPFCLCTSREHGAAPDAKCFLRNGGCRGGAECWHTGAAPGTGRGRLELGFDLRAQQGDTFPDPLGIKDPWALGRWWPRILCHVLGGLCRAPSSAFPCSAPPFLFSNGEANLPRSSPDAEGGIPSSVYVLSLRVPSQLGKAGIPGALL